ncbi:hypothetical protein K431DRAFT_284081 [Polychaeton citri CBS 116435]|uniref:F-box domain-containing protein n=1 Tax=Polychaeton citri CBS 116435 TaxID=1314669 RepID=A0A9P4Q9R6_9PEZI|nr:hypothetical protein K431DRAFT_284081 [Polychaeton citri CBS 116435]
MFNPPHRRRTFLFKLDPRPKYYSYSDEELDSYIEIRGLQLRSDDYRNWSKSVKAGYLELMDSERRFNFMNLPPELRNIVYVNLLTMRRTKEARPWRTAVYKCWPQILATSSIINAEASGLLWSLNEIEIRFAPDPVPKTICKLAGTQVDFKWNTHIKETLELVERPGSHGALRKGLKQTRQLHLAFELPCTLRHNQMAYDGCLRQMNNMLFALTTLIDSANRIEEVKVSLHYRGQLPSAQEVFLVLYPLRQVSGLPEVALGEPVRVSPTLTMTSLLSRWDSFSNGSVPSLFASKQDWSNLTRDVRTRYRQLQNIAVESARLTKQRGRWIQRPNKKYVKPLRELEKLMRNPLKPWENAGGYAHKYGWWGPAFESDLYTRLHNIRMLLRQSSDLIEQHTQAQMNQETSPME